MWTIFNPTDCNLEVPIGTGPNGSNAKIFKLGAGETLKFPEIAAEDLLGRYPFLKLLSKEDLPVEEKVYVPPKDLSQVPEAAPEPANQPRFIRHPASDPVVQETGGFNSGASKSLAEATEAVGGIRLKEVLEDGKLVKIDSDGVQWYGGGVSNDTLDNS